MTTVDGLTADRLERTLVRLRSLMAGEPDGGADLQPAIELVADELSLRRRADTALAAIRHREPLRAR